MFNWVEQTDWIDFLAIDPQTRSNTSVCLQIVDEKFVTLRETEQAKFVKSIVELLEQEGVAFDIGSHRDAPPGFRIWTGATIETEDVEALTPWLEWGFMQMKSEFMS